MARAFKITVEGAEKIAGRLNESLYKDPVKGLLDEGRRYGEQKAEERAPRGFTGQLHAGISSELRASSSPMYALVKADAVAPDGFRYAQALNASDRYHYRAGARTRKGRQVRGGKPTKGWMTKVLPLVRSHLGRLQRRAEQAIQQRWGGS